MKKLIILVLMLNVMYANNDYYIGFNGIAKDSKMREYYINRASKNGDLKSKIIEKIIKKQIKTNKKSDLDFILPYGPRKTFKSEIDRFIDNYKNGKNGYIKDELFAKELIKDYKSMISNQKVSSIEALNVLVEKAKKIDKNGETKKALKLLANNIENVFQKNENDMYGVDDYLTTRIKLAIKAAEKVNDVRDEGIILKKHLKDFTKDQNSDVAMYVHANYNLTWAEMSVKGVKGQKFIGGACRKLEKALDIITIDFIVQEPKIQKEKLISYKQRAKKLLKTIKKKYYKLNNNEKRICERLVKLY